MPDCNSEDMQPEILFADDRVIVCVKPQGVLSTDEPGGMPERLRALLGGDREIIKTVHRLDRVTGGVMVYARTRRAAADLEEQIRAGIFHKTYLAVVHGIPEPPSGEYRDWLHRDAAERKSYIVPPGTDEAQLAGLSYCVKERKDRISLVEVKLQTGRTHQIRCQFSGHGYPLFGDRKYGYTSENAPLALWAYQLAFAHPRDGKRMEFQKYPPGEGIWAGFDMGSK